MGGFGFGGLTPRSRKGFWTSGGRGAERAEAQAPEQAQTQMQARVPGNAMLQAAPASTVHARLLTRRSQRRYVHASQIARYWNGTARGSGGGGAGGGVGGFELTGCLPYVIFQLISWGGRRVCVCVCVVDKQPLLCVVGPCGGGCRLSLGLPLLLGYCMYSMCIAVVGFFVLFHFNA